MKTFRVKTEHLKLLRRLYFSYDDHTEFGAAEVNPKRPYGNSWVYGDIAEIIGMPMPDFDNGEDFTQEQTDYMNQIHKEMETVLSIMARTCDFTEGEFRADDYSHNWKRQ